MKALTRIITVVALICCLDSTPTEIHIMRIYSKVGQNVSIPCRATSGVAADWLRKGTASEVFSDLVHEGYVLNGYADRFAADSARLFITNLTKTDAGNYVCIEDAGQGTEHDFQLIVADVVDAAVDQTVALPCNTTVVTAVDWWYQTSPSEAVSEICHGGDIVYDRQDRFALNFNNLVIGNPQLNDTGWYICVEEVGQGLKHYLHLDVQAHTTSGTVGLQLAADRFVTFGVLVVYWIHYGTARIIEC